MNKLFAFAIAMAMCALAHAQFTFELRGQVAHVDDGDTIILHPGSQRVRLAEIDAPEIDHSTHRPGQPHGLAARAALVALMPIGSAVTAQCYERDDRGRAVCRVFYDGIDLSLEMVRLGHAHAYREYVRDPRILGAQEHAKAAQAGLWALSNAVYPQTWRRSCWDKSDTPLYCSVNEPSDDGTHSTVAVVGTTRAELKPDLPSLSRFGLPDSHTVIARARALTQWVTSIRWP